jgi:hypothetical protein
LGGAQQDHGGSGKVRGDHFHLAQFVGIAAHAVDHHEVGQLLFRNQPHAALAAFGVDHRVTLGLE